MEIASDLPILKYEIVRESSVVNLTFRDYAISFQAVLTQEECVDLGKKLQEIGSESVDLDINPAKD